MRALLRAFAAVAGKREVLDVQAGEQDRIERPLAGEVAGDRREPVDVLVLPRLAGVRQQVLGVDRPVRVAHEVHRRVAVVAVGRPRSARLVRCRKPPWSG